MAGVPYFKIYRDAKQQYRWRFTATNGKIIAVSSESVAQSRQMISTSGTSSANA